MNFLKNKFIIGCLCIVVSVALGGFVIPKVSENIMSDTIPVVVAQKDISENYQITEEDLKVVYMHNADSLPEGYSASIDDFKDKYAVGFVQSGDVLTASKVSEGSDYENDFIDNISSDADKFAVSVNVSGYTAVVGGSIRIGDVVTILDSHGATYPEIYYMQIIDITDSSGKQISDSSESAPAAITFSANIVQASKLSDLSQNDAVYLLLAARYSSDEKNAKSLIEAQERLFEEDEYYKELLLSKRFKFGE